MSEPKCETCKWFRLKGDDDLGYCHRRAPVTQGRPLTNTWDFCGEHEEKAPKANKGASRICATCKRTPSLASPGYILTYYPKVWVCSAGHGNAWGAKHSNVTPHLTRATDV